jgi:hypothetical protein
MPYAFLGVGGVLWPKLAIETPTTRWNFGKFQRWPVPRSGASYHRRYCLPTCWARYLQKGRFNSTDVAFVVAVNVRVSGERIFHVGRHGSHQKGNPRRGVPLISINIMISLLVISRIIFYRKHFWPPGSLFSDGGSNSFPLLPQKMQCRSQ